MTLAAKTMTTFLREHGGPAQAVGTPGNERWNGFISRFTMFSVSNSSRFISISVFSSMGYVSFGS